MQNHAAGPKSATRTVLIFEPNERDVITVAVDDECGRWFRSYHNNLFAIQAGLEQVCKSVQFELRHQKGARNPIFGTDPGDCPELPVAYVLLVTATYDAWDLELFVELKDDPGCWSSTGRRVEQLATDIANRLKSHPWYGKDPLNLRIAGTPHPLDVIPEHQNIVRTPLELVPLGSYSSLRLPTLHKIKPGVLSSPTEFMTGKVITKEMAHPKNEPPQDFQKTIDAFISRSEDHILHLMETESDLKTQMKDSRNEHQALAAARGAYMKRRKVE